MVPYIKNWPIFRCPSDAYARDSVSLSNMGYPANATGKQLNYAVGLNVDTGYNYMHLAPMVGRTSPIDPNGWQSYGKKMGVVQKAANCYMFLDSVWDFAGCDVPTGGGNWFVEAPSYWYSGTAWWFGGWQIDNCNSWLHYGGTFPRHTNRVNASFVDGHVKSQSVGDMLAGVNPRTYEVFDRQAFKWSVE